MAIRRCHRSESFEEYLRGVRVLTKGFGIPDFIATEAGTGVKHLEGNEWFGRGYLYWTPLSG